LSIIIIPTPRFTHPMPNKTDRPEAVTLPPVRGL
jgi:hypothetical protein